MESVCDRPEDVQILVISQIHCMTHVVYRMEAAQIKLYMHDTTRCVIVSSMMVLSD